MASAPAEAGRPQCDGVGLSTCSRVWPLPHLPSTPRLSALWGSLLAGKHDSWVSLLQRGEEVAATAKAMLLVLSSMPSALGDN